MPNSKARPGPLNLITDVEGLSVGVAEDLRARTGVTVVLADALSKAAVAVAGGGPGTRETDALSPTGLVGAADAITLSGGSVFGLAAADGVAGVLAAQGRGFRLRSPEAPPAPIVPGAVIYDLMNGGVKDWGEHAPYRELGAAATRAAGKRFELGTAGGGYGAVAGDLKGGLGSASVVTVDGITVGALAVVNCFGSVVGPDGSAFWAAPYELNREFGGADPAELVGRPDAWPHAKLDPSPRGNTTIACVATDLDLDTAELARVAAMAQAGLARAVRPVFSPFDGDVIFAVGTGRRPAPDPRPITVARVGALAADCLARAIARGVYDARAWEGCPVEDWRTRNSYE
jgi:L-aminopeptidase/D-esterase-like protein